MEVMNEIQGYLSEGDASTGDNSKEKIPPTSATMETSDSDEPSEISQPSRIPERPSQPMPSSAAGASRPSASSTASANSIRPRVPIGIDRFKYIPLRLTDYERKMLNVLNNALEVCEYTDVVDVTFSHTKKSKLSRILESLVDILSISCGLIISNNLTKGEQIVAGKTLNQNVPLFTELFEIGRRYKIMNPTRMRDTYGKLMYILMDSESYSVKQELNISFTKPIQTVYTFLKARDKLDILTDELWATAAMSVGDEYGARSKHEVAKLQADKQSAVKELLAKYTSESMPEGDVQRLIDSVADNEAYFDFNVKPVEKALQLLQQCFDPAKPEDPFSLALTSRPIKRVLNAFSSLYSGYSSSFMGSGASLSHNHPTQFKFVLQSLTLWREIMFNLPKLWIFADADMIQESYRLVDTGQGYQRLQASPNVRNEMNAILNRVQREAGSWVGLSVVHLADRDVPNALVFIDKYTQVPRILAPIVRCIESLPQLVEDRAFHRYVQEEWGSIDGLRLQILSDFFKHGFDGSGDDGGSCIDGRLTSAWNWCSKLHKKPYYHVFMFTGFQGFDGDWKSND